tara:strand:+ start:1892 stop:2359 length:468 start_codon:yes stop_codon:yes gene_type:complete
MANMKVVNTEWTGSCVIACDCGSEEPVEGTVHAVASGVLEDEIKKLRDENRTLKNTITDMHVEGKLLVTDTKLLRREVMRSQSIEQDGQGLISKGNAEINRLKGELSTWKKLWMKEREYRHNLSDRVDVATRGLRALSDKDPWARWPMKEANEEE